MSFDEIIYCNYLYGSGFTMLVETIHVHSLDKSVTCMSIVSRHAGCWFTTLL